MDYLDEQPLDDYGYIDSYEYLEQDDYQFEEDTQFQDDLYEFSLLNNLDYNLNSPILPDRLNALILYLNDLPYDQIHYQPTFEKVRNLFNRLNIKNTSEIPTVQEIYRLWPKIINRRFDNTRGISFLDRQFADIDKTYEIIRSFYNGWLGGTFTVKTCEDIQQSIKALPDLAYYWLTTFLDLFDIINLMNAKTILEQKNIIKRINGSVLIENKRMIGFIGKSRQLGRWAMVEEYLFLPKDSIIFDRNLLLMIKDLLIGRFQTVLAMKSLTYETAFSEEDISDLLNLYSIGDAILMKHGPSGYDSIKCLEMFCNNWLCEYSFKINPTYPRFDSFKGHVEETVQEQINAGQIEISDFFKQVDKSNKIDLTLVYYSSFRHWGHPPIEILEGLNKLEELVNEDHDVDDDYVQILASDLAYKVLKKKFSTDKKWYVDHTQLPNDHMLKAHIVENTWPTLHTRNQFGDKWHTLPLVKCFDIPDMIDLSSLYADKSHSMRLSDVINHVRQFPNKPIPTKRVLSTLLQEEAVNWPLFLKNIDEYGLPKEDLIIGLKPKERELKRTGRYFSLMSFNLRHYFVITELLIKEHFVPLFSGLTMADDLQELTKKLLDRISGQNGPETNRINIANGLDYTKWNNYQRRDSNKYVFRVMGQFLGYPSLIEKTHEFFEKSLIYYPGRPDLMDIQNGTLVNKGNIKVCWNGQKGGLEGLRQKGWSILNYLMIERESRVRNSMVKILAQGDNQIIFTSCLLESYYDQEELNDNLNRAKQNNETIMNAIIKGADKLGLVINQDETMQSCSYANYGKVVLFRGRILGLPTKRWARVTCSTNDQIPNLGTLLSSVSTNAMTVGYFSDAPHDAILGHFIFGLITLGLLMIHNPAIRGDPRRYIKANALIPHYITKITLLYLDPSLGGIGGTSLTRFLIRGFPDPVSESLAFWRLVYLNTLDPLIKRLCCKVGNPPLATYCQNHFTKLVENPESLNIPKGISAGNMIKEQIKNNLIKNADNIKNNIIHDAISQIVTDEAILLAWLQSIKPVFPRFNSEFTAATFYGLSTSLIGLFTNSRTIRNCFKTQCLKEVDTLIIKSEIIGLASVLKVTSHVINDLVHDTIWDCSSTQADRLRQMSWGQRIIGITVPHPIEMHKVSLVTGSECQFCSINNYQNNYITVICPKGLQEIQHDDQIGPFRPYLGSGTSEGTSILQPWEKETKIPIIKRAARLRETISWFVLPESNLGNSILNNLHALTGEDWSIQLRGFKRTGSALHRFKCSRVSNGGYSACNPTRSTFLVITSDTMVDLEGSNYDFMFQASMIFGQVSVGSLGYLKPCCFHCHINCDECLRPIEEPILESEWIYQPLDVSDILRRWRPDPDSDWGFSKQICAIQDNQSQWEILDDDAKTFYIGLILGFIYTDGLLGKNLGGNQDNLFPLSIRNKLHPEYFYSGLLRGIKLSSSLHLTHRRNIISGKDPKNVLFGAIYYAIENITVDADFVQFVSVGPLHLELYKMPHKIPPSYPLSTIDLGSLARSYLKYRIKMDDLDQYLDSVWAFADLRSTKLLCTLGLSILTDRLVSQPNLNKLGKERLKQLQEDYIKASNDELDIQSTNYYISRLKFCESEVRHACKFSMKSSDFNVSTEEWKWGNEAWGKINKIEINFDPDQKSRISSPCMTLQNPTVSGLRLFQCATGAHYKLRSIIKGFSIYVQDAVVGGDGSGGITALLLREFRSSRIVFNSLLNFETTSTTGSRPSPPSAVEALGEMGKRCINKDNIWKEPTDLRERETWDYFRKCITDYDLTINTIILDMEVTSDMDISKIEDLVAEYAYVLFNAKNSTLIFKTYLHRLESDSSAALKFGKIFKRIYAVNTEFSSTKTSEIYLVCQDLCPIKITNRCSLSDTSIQDLRKMAFINADFVDEFKRAKQIYSRTDLISGVPSAFLTDPLVDLSTLLVTCGMMSSDAYLIISHSSDNLSDFVEFLLYNTILLCNCVFDLTLISKNGIKIPSNPSINNFMSFLIGISIWLCLICSDEDISLQIHQYLNPKKKQRIFFYSRGVKNGDLAFWRLEEDHALHRVCIKNICTKHKMALIGQVIRLCTLHSLNFKDRMKAIKLDIKSINTKLKKRNKKMTVKYFNTQTDIFRFMPKNIFK
ncbi:RNA-dependent RNA polymerase L [Coastal Plains virus]|uniref:Replicase n=1 Tax=Coastal Plains virus TaxID=764599 RepID=D8V087_9RHAB|nr:RNA-dependent RNA polymerase L [Coastal Plains virus]ADG86364.1 RNA-dependent RNA polymerase L [Coastal Plains virus]